MKKILKNLTVCAVIVALLLSFSGCTLVDDLLVQFGLAQAPTPTAPGEDITFIVPWTADEITIPAYTDEYYIPINDQEPFFEESDFTTESYEKFSPLDELGRCGFAIANVGVDIMPTEDRESISSVYPTGWKYNGKSNNLKYDFVDGSYLYNRCHIIGFQLTGENANKLNLITGTRAFNVDAMLVFENMIADYVKETENHVLYRVTPIYQGDDLVAIGALMEGRSIEDDGEGVNFNVFCYNAQAGVTIDYATGQNYQNGETPQIEEVKPVTPPENEEEVVKAMDKNGNGKITISEAEDAGFQMPITSSHWLYKYMSDPDGDGSIG